MRDAETSNRYGLRYTPPLTRIFDRLIGGGISLYGDGI